MAPHSPRRGRWQGILLEITVLDVTEWIGGVRTRAFEEVEYIDGALFEISAKVLAICPQTGDIYCFGKDVDFNEGGRDRQSRRGLVPGRTLIGARFFQEIAPDIAEDRVEIIDITNGLAFTTSPQ
jgi:hypothetical protein